MHMGTSLRELIKKFRYRTLVLLKLMLLQKKVSFRFRVLGGGVWSDSKRQMHVLTHSFFR
jgi:hypothetical protein